MAIITLQGTEINTNSNIILIAIILLILRIIS